MPLIDKWGKTNLPHRRARRQVLLGKAYRIDRFNAFVENGKMISLVCMFPFDWDSVQIMHTSGAYDFDREEIYILSARGVFLFAGVSKGWANWWRYPILIQKQRPGFCRKRHNERTVDAYCVQMKKRFFGVKGREMIAIKAGISIPQKNIPLNI